MILKTKLIIGIAISFVAIALIGLILGLSLGLTLSKTSKSEIQTQNSPTNIIANESNTKNNSQHVNPDNTKYFYDINHAISKTDSGLPKKTTEN